MSDEKYELITDQAEREASGAHSYGRYLEEFEVGAVYKHWPAKTVTEADDHLFCLITMNHHPLHLNDVYAKGSQQGRNVVVGPLVYSLALGMSVSDVSGKAIANLATEDLSHPNPVFHGDTLFCETEVLEVKPSKSKPDRGVVKVHTRVLNQDGLLEHLAGLFGRAGVELDQHVDHDLLLVVLVEADVGEELAHAGLAEGAVGEELGGFGARAALDPVLVDPHRAGSDPRGAGDHPLPAVLDRDDVVVLEGEVGLVVHAVDALHERLLHLVDALGEDPAVGVDAADRVVVDLDLEVLGPAAVTAQPGRTVPVELAHRSIVARSRARRCAAALRPRRGRRLGGRRGRLSRP